MVISSLTLTPLGPGGFLVLEHLLPVLFIIFTVAFCLIFILIRITEE